MDADFVNKYNQVMSRLRQVENFDGSDATKLPQFLNKIDALMPTINTFDDYYRAQLLAQIKNKCTDRARDAVFTRQLSANATNATANVANGGNGVVKIESWHKIKEQLLHNYAERESSYSLIHKLRTSVLDSNIELYYQKMSKLKQRVINRKMTHNDTLYSLEDIERIALQVFRDHLPEPTHSMILRRNPKSMEEAYRYIVEVQQQFYTQGGPLGGEHGATFSTSHKKTFGTAAGVGLGGVTNPMGVGVGGVGIGVGLGIGAVGLGLGGGKGTHHQHHHHNHQITATPTYQQYPMNKAKSSVYTYGAPPVGAGKTNPMFKSSGNPTFKQSFNSSGGGGSGGSGAFDKNKSKDKKAQAQSQSFQKSGQKDSKTTSSGWRK